MKMSKTVEFRFQGTTMSYDEAKQFWGAVETAGEDCIINIHQSTYQDYGASSTTTRIEVESND